MRGSFASVIAVVTIVPSILSAQSDEISTLDVRPVCRGIAKQSTDPSVGKKGQTETFRRCMESEHVVRERLKNVWAGFSTADKQHCVALAKIGGLPSYTELFTCLEMVRDVRALRSAATPTSAVDTTTLTTMPSAESVSQPTPTKGLSKTEGETTTELERAKAEAQIAKASEELAQRKLADVEASLKGMREEAGRATAEAERAKADARVAREFRRGG